VNALTGDCGYCQSLGKLETAKHLDLDLTVVVVKNAASGYVKAVRHLLYGPVRYH